MLLIPDLKNKMASKQSKSRKLRKKDIPHSLWEKFIEESNQALGIADLKGNIVYANQALCDMLDEKNNDLIGKNVIRYYPRNERRNMRENILPQVARRGNWVGEIPLLSKLNRLTPAIQNIFAIHGSKGEPVYFANIITDIKERKVFERRQRNLNQIRFKILEKSPFGIYLVNEKGLIEYANPAMAKISGDTEEQFKSLNVFKLPTYKKLGLTKKIQDCIQGKNFFFGPVEYTSFYAKKTTMRNFVGISLKEEDGRKALIYVEDITELKKAESEVLEAHQRLMRCERMAVIGQLSGAIGHEFRNQLGIMRNIVYFLKLSSKNLGEKQQKHLNLLDTELTQTNNFIENVLGFGRKQKPQFRRIKLKDFLNSLLKKSNAVSLVRTKTNFDKHAQIIQADYDMLSVVLLNIITNALQAMESTRRKNGLLKFFTQKDHDKIKIIIEDNGCGINEKHLGLIFEPLFTTKDKGVGLGLFTCKIVVEAHGGKIEVFSRQKKGTRVEITLPLKQKIAKTISKK